LSRTRARCRSWSRTRCCYEPPETATPELEDELTGVEDEPSDELDEELEVVLDEVVAVLDAVDVVPGRVCALRTPSKPTPATALKATPTVSLLSKRIAASRACILPWVFGSMCCSLPAASESFLGAP
jgi:hypothetical protein